MSTTLTPCSFVDLRPGDHIMLSGHGRPRPGKVLIRLFWRWVQIPEALYDFLGPLVPLALFGECVRCSDGEYVVVAEVHRGGETEPLARGVTMFELERVP